jgi:hypothetical protein
VNQTRAFISTTQCSLTDYLKLSHRRRKKSLLSIRPNHLPDSYKDTVWTTWKISFDQLSAPAKTTLQLLSFMHHERIPTRLFEFAQAELMANWDRYADPLPTLTITFLSQFVKDSGWDSLHFGNVLAELYSFSLVSCNRATHMLSLHPLVQEWSREIDPNLYPAVHAVVALAVPNDETAYGYSYRRLLLPHLRTSQGQETRLSIHLLWRTGRTYWEAGALKHAT